MVTISATLKAATDGGPATHWLTVGHENSWRQCRAGSSGCVEFDSGNGEWLVSGWFNHEMNNRIFFKRIDK